MKYWIVYWERDIAGVLTDRKLVKKLEMAIEKYGYGDVISITMTHELTKQEIDQVVNDFLQ